MSVFTNVWILSTMKIILFYIYMPFVYSELHTLMTTYTGIGGDRTEGTPEFFAVTTLDGHQIDYYDSNINKLIPKVDWITKHESEEMWKENTDIRRNVHHIYRNNIADLMKRFNQTSGFHVYQRKYGCSWDDETREVDGFDQYGYDGEDYIMLDLKEAKYITRIPQGQITVNKWNEKKKNIQLLQQYYKNECVHWLKQFWTWKVDLESKAPKVFLLQKNQSSPVVCLATEFYPSTITVSWEKNGEDQDENVHPGKVQPNEDGTFQQSVILNIPTHKWMEYQYSCVVKHMGITFKKMLTEDEIKTNNKYQQQLSFGKCLGLMISIAVFLVFISIVVWKLCMAKLCIKNASSKTRDLAQDSSSTQCLKDDKNSGKPAFKSKYRNTKK